MSNTFKSNNNKNRNFAKLKKNIKRDLNKSYRMALKRDPYALQRKDDGM